MNPTKLPNDKGLWAVPVPMNAYDFDFMYDSLYYITHPNQEYETDIFVRKGKFEILGYATKDEISFDVAEYLTKETHNTSKGQVFVYSCYDGRYTGTTSKEEAFRSLLSAAGLHFENPYGKERPEYFSIPNSDLQSPTWIDCVMNWQQAEANLIEKLIIIREI